VWSPLVRYTSVEEGSKPVHKVCRDCNVSGRECQEASCIKPRSQFKAAWVSAKDRIVFLLRTPRCMRRDGRWTKDGYWEEEEFQHVICKSVLRYEEFNYRGALMP
jgi:hypothetical protein